MNLRPATTADQDALYRLHVELFRHHIEEIWGWNEEWQVANFLKEWDEAMTEVIGHDGEMAGCLQTRQEADHLYVLGIGLHPRFQGRGIGAAVMDAVKQRAASIGLPVRLSVFRTNPRALEFYLRLGFRQTGESESGRTMEWQPPQD